MPLKLYGNLLSQPCRAVFMLLKASKIPYEFKFVDMAKGMLLSID
jgi:glutathione S-transferase